MEQTQYANDGQAQGLPFVVTQNAANETCEQAATNRYRITIVDKLLLHIFHNFSLSNITSDIKAVCLGIGILLTLSNFETYFHLGAVHDYLCLGIQLVTAFRIVYSGRHSLALPTAALAIGLGLATHMSKTEVLYGYSQEFFGHMAVVGVVGLLLAILTLTDAGLSYSTSVLKRLNLIR